MLVVFASHLKVCEAYTLQGMLSAHGLRACVWHEFSPALYPELTFGGAIVAVDNEDLADAEEVYRAPLAEVGEAWKVPPEEAVPDAFEVSKYPDFVMLVKLFVKWFLVLGFILHFAPPMLPYFDEIGQGTVVYKEMGEQFRRSCELLAMDAIAGVFFAALMAVAFRIFARMRDSPAVRHCGAAAIFLVYKLPDISYAFLLHWSALFGW